MQIKREIKPQPRFPIISFFSEEGAWCYQSPESFDDMPELTYNALWHFEDKNQPGQVGDFYQNGGIIESVKVIIENGVAYWVIDLQNKGGQDV